ncbi:NUDIX hydrolase domain-like protein [Obelidium mucronatum]|nr:NUDIX hydrolase domain-like protein [Obelidium mucronatum]
MSFLRHVAASLAAAAARPPAVVRRWKYAVEPPRQAGVLAVLVAKEKDGEAALLFTRRSAQLRTHGGDVAFPGGKADGAETPLAAALRETREEIGVDSRALALLGALPPLPDRALATEVSPFVAAAWDSEKRRLKTIDELNLVLNRDEVDYAFAVSLADLLDPTKQGLEDFRGSKSMQIPTWYGPNNERIWGLTAFILNDLLKRVIIPAQRAHELELSQSINSSKSNE